MLGRAPTYGRRPGKGAALSFLPRAIHRIAVTNLRVVDLTSDAALYAVGLVRTDLAGDWSLCQAVGAAAQFLGLGGVVAPSATGAGLVIAAFETHIEPGQLALEYTEMIDPATLV